MNTHRLLLATLFLLSSVAALEADQPSTPVPFDPVTDLVLCDGGIYIGKKLLKKRE